MADYKGVALAKLGFELDQNSLRRVNEAFFAITDAFQKEFDLISSATWDGFKDYSRDTSKDVTKTWESTTKDMKNLTAKSLWGTVSAWFEDDMDQVEDIWEDAWQSMLGKADTLWDGFLNIAAQRLQTLLRKIKGPEVFPGALALGTAA